MFPFLGVACDSLDPPASSNLVRVTPSVTHFEEWAHFRYMYTRTYVCMPVTTKVGSRVFQTFLPFLSSLLGHVELELLSVYLKKKQVLAN